jgi:serpin B
MTYAGARGQTEEQMADTLHFILSQDRLHPAFNSLDLALSQRGQNAEGKDGEGFQLNIANAIWGQKDYQFLSSFLDTLAQNYGAGLRLLDFINSPEESRDIINKWVSDQTNEKIQDLIPQGAIDELTRLVLTNAIYFNAAWCYPFDEDKTENGPFYLLNGEEISVPMMKMMKESESLRYAEGEGYQAVELPYDGEELSMVILLPEEGNFAAFEDTLTAERVKAIINDLEERQVSLSMPKFEFESSFNLKEALAGMGMSDAFSANADFSGMAGNRDLVISDIVHKAFVSVDESGTEAAAAAAVVMSQTSVSPETSVEITIDHPFMFLIRDIETGAILFVGRVMNPNG